MLCLDIRRLESHSRHLPEFHTPWTTGSRVPSAGYIYRSARSKEAHPGASVACQPVYGRAAHTSAALMRRMLDLPACHCQQSGATRLKTSTASRTSKLPEVVEHHRTVRVASGCSTPMAQPTSRR